MTKTIQLSARVKDHLDRLLENKFSLTGAKLQRFLGSDCDDCNFLNFVGTEKEGVKLGFAFEKVEQLDSGDDNLVACVVKYKNNMSVRFLKFNEFHTRLRILNKISRGVTFLTVAEVFSIGDIDILL